MTTPTIPTKNVISVLESQNAGVKKTGAELLDFRPLEEKIALMRSLGEPIASDDGEVCAAMHRELTALLNDTVLSFGDIDATRKRNAVSYREALARLLKIFNLQESVFARVSLPTEKLTGFFELVLEYVIDLCVKAKLSPSEIVDLAYDQHVTTRQSKICPNLVHDFAEILSGEGVALLRSKLEADLTDTLLKFFGQDGLKQLADLDDDVDAYIAACSLFGKPSERCALEIAERLVIHDRSDEALTWLSYPFTCVPYIDDELRAKRYNLFLECGAESQALRELRVWFLETFHQRLYRVIAQSLLPAEELVFRKEAIKKASTHDVPTRALLFLFSVDALSEAIELIKSSFGALFEEEKTREERAELIVGADKIRAKDRLSATLLYRHVLEAILTRGDASEYPLAVACLKACDELAEDIISWGPHTEHKQFFDRLQVVHKRKGKFWIEYQKE